MKTLLLIDANALIHRSFHALPSFISANGKPTGALYGLSSILLKILKNNPPQYAAAFFDRPEPTFRKKEYAQYKAHREKKPDELISQIIAAHNIFKAFSINTYEAPGFEADDLIGTATERFKKEPDLRIKILTGDLDTLQLIDGEKVVVETLKKGVSETVTYGEMEVIERFGIKPSQIKDYKGLVGDSSDNIPGISGVGPKTAQQLIQKYGELENFFETFSAKPPTEASGAKETRQFEKIFFQKDAALFSKYLATIRTDAPLEIKNLKELEIGAFPLESVVEHLKGLGFKSILRRLDAGVDETEAKEEHPKTKHQHHANQGMLNFDHQPTLSKKIIDEMERPLEPILKAMEEWGIKTDAGKLKKKLEGLNREIADLTQKIYKEAGKVFNINSPKQLLEILKSDFRLKINSTNEAKIEPFKNIPIVELVLKYRELFKLKSTYIEPLLALAQSEKDKRIHPTFVQLKAATGRITCENPNLQNIPEWVRDIFVADNGCKFVSLDYSQIELRIMAHLSGDKKMTEAFINNLDIHSITASNIFNTEIESVTPEMRRVAKTLNFGIIYGMGSRALAQQSGLSQSEAKKFISEYFNDFPSVKEWREKTISEVREKGFAENLNGRIRVLPEIASFNHMLQAEAERMASNFPIQSLGADILKLAMVKTKEYLDGEGLWGDKVKMLLTIHDELIFEICDSPAMDEIVKRLREIMENVYKLSVPLKVNVKIGRNWGEL